MYITQFRFVKQNFYKLTRYFNLNQLIIVASIVCMSESHDVTDRSRAGGLPMRNEIASWL